MAQAIVDLEKRFTRTRDSFGFGISHYPTRWESVVNGLELYCTILNTKEICCMVNARVVGYDRSSPSARRGLDCGTDWTIVYITPAEMIELDPTSSDWVAAALAACKSDVHSGKPAFHPDMLATE